MTGTLASPMQVIAACVDEVRSSLPGLDDGAVLDLVRGVERAARMVHSVLLDALAEVDSRRLAAPAGFRSTASLLGELVQLSRTEARLRVEQVTQLGVRRALSGAPLAPALPETAAALAAGEIGPAHTRVITEILDAVPVSVTAAQRTQVEADLAQHARRFGPTELAKLCGRLVVRQAFVIYEPRREGLTSRDSVGGRRPPPSIYSTTARASSSTSIPGGNST